MLLLRATEATFQTAWFMISLLTELAVVLVLRSRLPAWSTLVVAMGALCIPYLGAAIAIVAMYIAATEWGKSRFLRGAS